jgi:hypothetical protein
VALEFRSTSPADAEPIARLCERSLGVRHDSPALAPAQMQWKYWDAWPGWDGPRSFVLIKAGEIIAHTGLVVLRHCLGERVHTLAQPIDWAADPGHVGAGAVLLQRVAGVVDGLVSVRGSAMTRRMLAPMGFRPFGECVRVAAPLKRDAGRPPRDPEAVRVHTDAVRVHTVERFDADEHPLATAVSEPNRIVFRRTREEIRRWVACPTVSMRYLELRSDDGLVGCALLCDAPGQVRIVDAWATDRVGGATDLVMAAARDHAAQSGEAGEVVCQTNDAAQLAALERVGFVAVGTDPLWIRSDRSVVPDGAHIRHQLLDSDLAFLHHGEPLPWLT